MSNPKTLAQLFLYRDAELVWARVDTRWHVYPGQEPAELAVHNYEGWWLPMPDGRWYHSPVSYCACGPAHGPALLGTWVETPTGTRCNGRELTITSYQPRPAA